ncbi:unnamed protein product [Protopolystoma xenopodis]|uniref:Laminin G domain-containing protein n=1 Tax=Protopolystoma xenopodis TaxID=117903 RepID=A0A448X0H6_9PLAT|nr:unnamed protein product [Protopolystoma xenopodis]
MDGDTVYLIDFEEMQHTLTTHRDDISLQFKTEMMTTPLFHAVSSVDEQFFRVELVGGRIVVRTNMNVRRQGGSSEEVFNFQSPLLSDGQWHTVNVRRRANFIYVSVDGQAGMTGEIPVKGEKPFHLATQQIYLGGPAPKNYEKPPPRASRAGFLPEGVRFTGELRNFYWNEYDFIGTEELSKSYATDLLTPRAVVPEFPQWPREPTYSLTLMPRLRYAALKTPIKMKEAGDMVLIEFKTEYDGVILHVSLMSHLRCFCSTVVFFVSPSSSYR